MDDQAPISSPTSTTSQVSYDPESERHNSYGGPALAWLGFTANERDLTASLDQTQSNDLSMHLYNAHALKTLAYDRRGRHEPSKQEQAWIKASESEESPWVPTQSWTTWPMSAQDVPRSGERHGNLAAMKDDNETIRRVDTWFPSNEMEDEILALLLRKAKEQLRSRQTSKGRQDVQILTPDDADLKRQNTADVKISSSQRDKHPASIKTDPADLGPPIITVDDDLARDVLSPSVRHILSRLDDLLSALYKSRSGTTAVSSLIDYHTSQSKKRKRVASEADQTSWSTILEASQQPHATTQEQEAGRRRHVPIRDWSEVLGMAALIGWSPETVQRAFERCSSLFKECMNFDVQHKLSSTGSANESLSSAVIVKTEPNEKKGTKLYACPYSTCPRSKDSLLSLFRYTRHLKQKHGWQDSDIASQLITPGTFTANGTASADSHISPSTMQNEYLASAMAELTQFTRSH